MTACRDASFGVEIIKHVRDTGSVLCLLWPEDSQTKLIRDIGPSAAGQIETGVGSAEPRRPSGDT